MTLGIHTLDIGVVVHSLCAVVIALRGIRTGRAAKQQPKPGTDRRTVLAANGRAGQSANHRTDRRVSHAGILRLTANLLESNAPTPVIVKTKFFIVPSASRQGHYAGCRRHPGTGCEQDQRQSGNYCLTFFHSGSSHQHQTNQTCPNVAFYCGAGGCGATFCQPPGHSFT